MCGISGIINTKFKDEFIGQVEIMNETLKHRGPDSKGLWISENKQVLFGHTRLSIIDIDNRSSQPFISNGGRFSLTFNGEIYNYIELRDECIKLGSIFTTQSDTEVFIECYKHWGPSCFKRFKGMWAAAVYDSHQNTVCISRDFFGIKPLYYSLSNGLIYFASEIKALRNIDTSFIEEDKVTTRLFIENAVIDRGNWTFYKKIKRFPSVSYSLIDLNKSINDITFNTYWSPFEVSYKGYFKNEADITQVFKELFIKSVKLHSRSDVKIGSCLSGGLDSSSIVSVASKFNSNFSTFTTCFSEYPDIDESKLAKLISDKYKTKQFYAIPTSKDFEVEFDNIIKCQDEPYGSTSIFSQYMVFKRISQEKIKVILDGQGADEALGGYIGLTPIALNTFFNRSKYLRWFSESIKFSRNHKINYFNALKSLIINSIKRKSITSIRYDDLIKFKDFDLYEERINELIKPPTDNIEEYLLYLLFDGNLQQLLRYEDRNSMNFSIESRVPFLEPNLISFICQLPFEYKFKDGFTKSILRNAFKSDLPEQIIWQKNKLGFASPEKELLKKVFAIDVESNGSIAWRNLIANRWRTIISQ